MTTYLVNKTTLEQWGESSNEDVSNEVKDLEAVHLDLARHIYLLKGILVKRSKADLKCS